MTVNAPATSNGNGATARTAPLSKTEQMGPNGDAEAIGYEIPDVPMGTRRKVRVVTIGGGASGINLAYQIQKHMENVEHVVYERNPELGGTWYENTYPGCACDVPSHAYQFSFHPSTEWTHFYSGSKEINEYMNSIVDAYALRDQFKVEHEVLAAHWDDGEAKWVVKVKGPDGVEFEDRADFLVNGSGVLNKWKWPAIEGIHDFKGHLVHTAQWDSSYDYKGKRIAVIGVGSSAVQCIPHLRTEVEHMTCFIRSGAWIMPMGAAAALAGPGGANKAYTAEEKKRWAENPAEFLQYRKDVEDAVNSRFRMYLKDTPEQAMAINVGAADMRARLAKKPELAELLVPKFDPGCRRLTPGNGFLEALCEDNVDVVTSGIVRITPTGLVTADGREVAVDAIVCATGFDTSYLPRMPFIGKNGADLHKRWSEGVTEAYMSLMVPEYPNYFISAGPAGPVAHGSVSQVIERLSIYMLKCISKMQAEGIRAIAPRADRTRQINIHRNALMPKTAWGSGGCSSWYKGGTVDAPVVAIHAGSKHHFLEMIKEPRFEDMDIEYEAQNPFAYLGNGFSLMELEPGNDLSWYVTDPFTQNIPWSRESYKTYKRWEPEAEKNKA